MKKMRVTHYDRILNHLNQYGSITSWEAIREYGITRLSAVIYELRKEYNIVSTFETTKNRYGDKISYAKYILEK